METYLIWRLLKFIFLAVLAGGVFGVMSAASPQKKIQALAVASIGFIGTWAAGYGLSKFTGISFLEIWIMWGLVASLFGFHCTALLAHKAHPKKITYVLNVGGLLVAVGVMSARSADIALLIVLTVICLAVASLIVHLFVFPGPSAAAASQAKASGTPAAADEAGSQWREWADLSWNWFKWVARFEGLSLVLLVLVNMPLKKAAGLSLDGGTGLLGWVHGVLFLVFLQALASTGRMAGWSLKVKAYGFVASIVPFGTFVFERWVKSNPNNLGPTG